MIIALIEIVIDLVVIGVVQLAGFISRTLAFKQSKPKLSDFNKNLVATLFLFILVVSVFSLFFKM